MAPPFQRARKPEEREERITRLLDSAHAMLREGMPVADLSLNGLARRAGMAKSNVYRYFESREAVLLALLEAEWAAWSHALVAEWPEAVACGVTADAVADRLARTLSARPLLGALTAVLPTVLEQNLSEAALARFKRAAHALVSGIGADLAARAPGPSAAAYAELVVHLSMVVAGVYPNAYPNPVVARVLEADPTLQTLFRRDYEQDLRRISRALLREMEGAAGTP